MSTITPPQDADARIADLEAKWQALFRYFEHIASRTALPSPAEFLEPQEPTP